MERDDEQHLSCSFFCDWRYSSKSDITQTVIEFYRRCNHPFRVVKSDGRLYKAECTGDTCLFVVHNFRSRTRSVHQHNFHHTLPRFQKYNIGSQLCATAKQIATNPAVREMTITFGWKVTPVMIEVEEHRNLC